MQSLKIGMTRKDIASHNFVEAGGMVFRDHTRYDYKSCEYIHLEVDFSLDPSVDKDMSPKDMITGFSKLTLDLSHKGLTCAGKQCAPFRCAQVYPGTQQHIGQMRKLISLHFGNGLRSESQNSIKLRRKRGFSQEDFAHECQFQRSYYMGALERREKNVTIKVLVHLQKP